MRIGFFGLLIGFIALVYGGLWWYGRASHPLVYGVSFSSQHAAWLHLDWKSIYREMLSELQPTYLRLSADWNEVEKIEGTYDFSSVDFMMTEAGKRGSKVVLAIGQKTPRWPECHTPGWVTKKTDEEYLEKLYTYIETTVLRYKNHDALEYWQVENEPYIMFDFGNCPMFQPDAVEKEFDIVRTHDTAHSIVVTDSGELSVWYPAAKRGDIFGSTMYRVVTTEKGTPLTYDWLPLGWYRARARILGLTADRFFISELQAEPWIGSGNVTSTPIDEQFKTMGIDRMKKNLEDAKHTGASRAYLWGVEWWYWMKHEKGDNSFVNVAKEYIKGK